VEERELLEGRDVGIMDGGTQIGYRPGVLSEAHALRARLIQATVELVAEGGVHRLGGTRPSQTAV